MKRKYTEAMVEEAKSKVDEQFDYIAKVFGISADNEDEVKNLKRDDWSEGFFDDAMKTYKDLCENLRKITLLNKVTDAMEKHLICSVEEAEEAVDFVAEVLESMREDCEQYEPYAVNAVEHLKQSYRDVCDITTDLLEEY